MRKFLVFLLALIIAAAIFTRVRYGGGKPYADLSTPPILGSSALEQVLQYPEPIGNVVVGGDGRLFFTVHPESRPQGNKLLEWVSGAAVPYPSGTVQPQLFDSLLGLTLDSQNRLWTIDHGSQGFGVARLIAFDLATGEVVHDHTFSDSVAPLGSLLQDLRVSSDGRFVVIADGSVLRKRPAIVIYEIAPRAARRILESHESVSAENYVIRNPIKDLSFVGGLFTLKIGVSGIAIDANDEWLYYGAANQSGLYRVPMQYVTDPSVPPATLAQHVERYSEKPFSDGLTNDETGNIYITDVEHSSIFLVGKDRQIRTLIRSEKIRWAAAVAHGPGDYIYVSDSAFPELILETKDHISSAGPFSIYRFRFNASNTPID